MLMSWFAHQKWLDEPVTCRIKGCLLKYAAITPRFCHLGTAAGACSQISVAWLDFIAGYCSASYEIHQFCSVHQHSKVPLTLEGTLKIKILIVAAKLLLFC